MKTDNLERVLGRNTWDSFYFFLLNKVRYGRYEMNIFYNPIARRWVPVYETASEKVTCNELMKGELTMAGAEESRAYYQGVRHARSYNIYASLSPKKIIQHGPATIVWWNDGTKTVVKRKKGDKNDIDSAVAQAITKKLFGTSRFHKFVERAQEDKK